LKSRALDFLVCPRCQEALELKSRSTQAAGVKIRGVKTS